MGLDKGTLISMLESALRSMEPGTDGVASLATQFGNAIDIFVKSGKVLTDSTAGGCNYSGTHPTISSEGHVE